MHGLLAEEFGGGEAMQWRELGALKPPDDSPFERFPEGTGNDSTQGYLNCLGSYFRVNPYRGWFHQYDAVLDGAQASYYPGKPSTALHTNFVSPIASNPSLFVFDPSSRIPFGLFNHQLKNRIGELAREKFLERTKAR